MDLMKSIRWVMFAFCLNALVGSAYAADGKNPDDAARAEKVCRDATMPEGDMTLNFTLTEPTPFSSNKKEICCFKLLQNSVFVSWVADFYLDAGFYYVRRCIENAHERTNRWTKGGAAFPFYEQIHLNPEGQFVSFTQVEKEFVPRTRE